MMYKIFAKKLQSSPDAIAIVTSVGKTYTYAEANRRVNQWANYLAEHDVKTGDQVAVLLDNEDDHVFLLLALNRLNAGYVPFDADIPKRQLDTDISSLSLKKFIIEDTLAANFNIPEVLKITLSQTTREAVAASSEETPATPYSTDGSKYPLYIVFSSGSTGEKKGIPSFGDGVEYWADVEKKLFKPDIPHQ